MEKTFLKTFFKSSSGGILSIETFLETSDFSVLEIESGSWFCIYIDLLVLSIREKSSVRFAVALKDIGLLLPSILSIENVFVAILFGLLSRLSSSRAV